MLSPHSDRPTDPNVVSSVQFTWAGQKYRVDLPNGAVEGAIRMPNGGILMIKGPQCQPVLPDEDEIAAAIHKVILPRAELLR